MRLGWINNAGTTNPWINAWEKNKNPTNHLKIVDNIHVKNG
jgi:hypothetical protein